MYKKIKNMFHTLSGGKKVSLILAFVLAGALVIMVPTLAWFSYQRGMGDMQYVDSPMELYITAGNGEDLSYLNLFDIKVTDPNKDCEYYVFGVCGTDATGYNLQLAYTTNNQFEYFIYPAKEVASTASYLVDYTAHNEDGSPGEVHYYAIDPDNIVTTGYTGNASGDESSIVILSLTFLSRLPAALLFFSVPAMYNRTLSRSNSKDLVTSIL